MKRQALNFSESLEEKFPASLEGRCPSARKALFLHELRHMKALSQVNLAELLDVHQAAISKMENRTDMCISTLREYIRAMGGDLEIIARFPEGPIKVLNFDAVSSASQVVTIEEKH